MAEVGLVAFARTALEVGRAVLPLYRTRFIPLHIVVGAAEGSPGQIICREENFFGKITASSCRFGK
jgi:hypothetical protein